MLRQDQGEKGMILHRISFFIVHIHTETVHIATKNGNELAMVAPQIKNSELRLMFFQFYTSCEVEMNLHDSMLRVPMVSTHFVLFLISALRFSSSATRAACASLAA